jgi:7,8-dihydropterin-6-yl-methyl-4-(beta-D-ribofuranosyl)aminobenzene 5'-phosphate synthase
VKKLLFLLSCFLFFVFGSIGSPQQESEEIKVTILYDNYEFAPGARTDWGFSCLIQGTEKTILFDAGTQPEIFYHNVETIGADLSDVDLVVISHEHGDHTGALPRLFKERPNLTVYHPVSFSDEFVSSVKRGNATPVPVTQPVEICKNVYSTGEMGTEIKEQSLILKTGEGLVVITGCSHPGIVEILERTKQILDEDIYMAFGGLHLMNHSDEAVHQIIQRVKELGVKKSGAMHCTGDRQIELFKRAFGENFVTMGVGKVVTFQKPK